MRRPTTNPAAALAEINALLAVQEAVRAALLAAETLGHDALEDVEDIGDKLEVAETLTRLYTNLGDVVMAHAIDAPVRLVAVAAPRKAVARGK